MDLTLPDVWQQACDDAYHLCQALAAMETSGHARRLLPRAQARYQRRHDALFLSPHGRKFWTWNPQPGPRAAPVEGKVRDDNRLIAGE